MLVLLMSAISPNINFNTRETRAAEDVRGMIVRLSFQRRLWLACRRVLTGLTCVVAILFLEGIVDYFFHIPRFVRLTLVGLLVPCAVAGFVFSLVSLIRRPRLTEMARDVERATGRHENSLVTFAETIEHTNGLDARPYVLARLEAQARRAAIKMDASTVTTRRNAARAFIILAVGVLLLLAFRVLAPIAFARESRRILWLESDRKSSAKYGPAGAGNSGSNAVTVESLDIRVVPPAYSGLSVEEVTGDEAVRVLTGSQIEVELTASGKVEGATLGFGGAKTRMRAQGEGNFNGSFAALTSGAFEVQVISGDDAPAPFVRAIEVYSDARPEVHITEPISDQLLRGVPVRPVPVRWTAKDDLGLAEVVLKYIRSRGEGDAAQFVNGSLDLIGFERTDTRDWRGGTSIDLTHLGLQAGDTLVYWIEARDKNPSANNTGRSASLAIAIIAPEPLKLNLGDLGPNEIGRFLLSERMIIIHTENLHAERSRLARDELLRRAGVIAAEQRDFKNSFNDYMSVEGTGEERHDANTVGPQSVEERVREADEERTGVHMHGIPDPPPGTPSSVRDMTFAIRAMWDAEEALSLGDTQKALGFEREALTLLKRAQLAVRYVPPVFARSKSIDLKRRYAGELNEIKTRLEKLSPRSESKETVALRAALTEAYAALAELQATLDAPVTTRASAVARAQERAQQSANSLAGASGDHATTIAEALGQLRIVETELSHLDVGGTSDNYALRVSKALSLLTRAAANLFAIAEARTHANGGETNVILPGDDRRTSEYFRRLNK